MLLTIHDASLRKVAFIDNDKQATLNYFNDSWTRYLETGSSTFDFTVFKKAIISDVGRKRAYNYLNEKAFVSFQYKGKTYLHTIRKIEENEKTIKCYGINLNLELINEYANPYKATKAMTFKEYCDAMDLLNFTFLKIGVNEVSTQKITAEWEGADTKLNRLLSLAKKFGAEIEFDTYLNADSSIKSFVINVYHENDDTHQGVGRISPTVLTYGKNLKTLTRTVDKTNIYNMVRPTGRTDNGDIVTISGLSAWSVNNAKGEREFYQAGEGLYAPLSMQMYPSAFTSKTTNDQWIRKDMQVESSNPDVIRSMAYRELKKNCYPAVTYEAEGFADLEIGDTVQVYDDGFSPVLLLEMRVSEQSISFTNSKNNKTTFSNAKALENRLSGGIQQRIDQMIEDAKPYTIKVATDNGVGFKNSQGQSVVTPTLMKGNKVINSGWRWVVDGIIKSTSPSYIVKATDINHTMVLTITAWVDNKEVASEQITFINTLDGTAGRGIASVDTYYLLTGMSAGVTRDIAGWTQTVKTPTLNQRFVWSYRVENYSDGTSSVGEPHILSIYGEKGDTGPQGPVGATGLQGPKGDQGIQGPSGTSSYTHLAYANSADGTVGFSVSDNTNKTYIGMYVDNVATDSTDPTKYKWNLIKGQDGAQGIQGPAGADGKTPFWHTAWANSADGKTDFSLTDSTNKRFIGQYTDYTQTDSTDPTKYKWVNMVGTVDVGGRNLLIGLSEIYVYQGTSEFLRTADLAPVIDKYGLVQYTLSFEAKVAVAGNVQVYMQNGAGSRYSGLMAKIDMTTGWKRYSITFTPTNSILSLTQSFLALFGTYGTGVIPSIKRIKVERGNIATDYSPAPEDIDAKIDSKADDALTQEQLNALNEKAGIIQAELDAKASADTLDNWIKAYQDFVKANDAARAQAENDLISASQRVSTIAKDLGELSDRWNFIDTYMSSSNEGLVIGKNDGSSSMLFSPNGRISMFSAGVEVMYISQGVIHIENGIFSKTIQIGRFREEQYHLNPDMNVIRYVG
ncbi:phage tail spike protein [Streptococcus uberis]|uniref:phage tail spike protein n=1 Tax=Streptococcus uberis TaxID=1349 RepID=UPI0021F1F0EB|nr:phage tail spike protein [Streptococcus uberis]MCV6815295.1 phage tail protein [Streptococcus uberis]MCZ8475562.1 phage tail protein [Streptococcus uberis]